MFFGLAWLWKYGLGPIIGVIIGQAGLLVLHRLGHFPEVWLANQILSAPSMGDIEGAHWIVALFIALIVWIGGSWLFTKLERRRAVAIPETNTAQLTASGFVKAPGLWFFTYRAALARQTGTLGERLKSVDSADMYLVIGQGFFGAFEHLDKAARVLFPDPDSEPFQKLMISRGMKKDIALVKKYARQARTAGADVKFAKHFIFRSMVLADADKDGGWVHIEEVLPHVEGENRVSYTVFREEHRECVEHYRRLFKELWDEGVPLT